MGLLKACSATPIIVEMCFSILQSVDMKLARYLQSFTSSINSHVALESAFVCGFIVKTLVLVPCSCCGV